MASDKIINTTDKDFKHDVVDSSTPVLVDFWATWCGPCRAIAPHLKALADELGDRVKIVKLDIDHNQKTAADYGIQSIPTLLLFKDGKVVDKLVGSASKGKLSDFITSKL